MKNRFEEVQSLYDLAKQQINQLEIMGEGLSIPAINELRYAGEHILKASTADTDEIKKDQLLRAEKHCWRAIHDGVELGSIIALKKLKEFQEDYKGLPVTEYIPEYQEILGLASRLQNLLAHGEKIEPQEYYHQVNQYLPELMDKLSVVERTRDILHKELKSKQQATKSWLFVVFLSIAVSVFSAFIYEFEFFQQEKEPTIQSEIDNLAEVQKSLSNLQSYVSSQQSRLNNINADISNLTHKREELEKAVNVSEEALHRVLQTYESNQSVFSVIEIGVTFLVGSLSSFFVVLFVSFLKRRRLIENT